MRTTLTHVLALTCIAALGGGCEDERGTFDPNEITISGVANSDLWKLDNERLVYLDTNGDEWVAPKGTRTDGASIPQIALSLTGSPFDKKFLKAAVVHDAYCQTDNKTVCREQYRSRDWRSVHKMFHEACVACGSSQQLADFLFAFVWMFGPKWDDSQVAEFEAVPEEMLHIGFDGCARWIRGSSPTRDEIEAWLDEREPILVELARFEAESATTDDPAAVDRAVDEAGAILTEALEASPDDVALLNLRGRLHRHAAVQNRRLNRDARVTEDLQKAEQAFRKVESIAPNDPVALTELARVSILRNDLDAAEASVRRVLETEPEHPIAVRELAEIERRRAIEGP